MCITEPIPVAHNRNAMNIQVQAVNFNAGAELCDFIAKKYAKLRNYYDKITAIQVYLKVANTPDKRNKVVETKLSIPREEIVVKKTCRTFEEGTDLSLDILKRRISRCKEKTKIH